MRTLRPSAHSISIAGSRPAPRPNASSTAIVSAPVTGAVLAVEVEERVELEVQLAPGPCPQQAATGEPARLDVVAGLAQNFVQPGAVLGRPRPADARDADQLGQEPVERVVHDVALVERRELDELLGTLDPAARRAGSARSTRAGTSPTLRAGSPTPPLPPPDGAGGRERGPPVREVAVEAREVGLRRARVSAVPSATSGTATIRVSPASMARTSSS